MNLDDFASMTQRIIADDGFERYVPTACYPGRRVIRVLEDVPVGADIEQIALDWAFGAAEGDEEVLVAFKTNESQFKVVRRSGGQTDERLYSVNRPGLQ